MTTRRLIKPYGMIHASYSHKRGILPQGDNNVPEEHVKDMLHRNVQEYRSCSKNKNVIVALGEVCRKRKENTYNMCIKHKYRDRESEGIGRDVQRRKEEESARRIEGRSSVVLPA